MRDLKEKAIRGGLAKLSSQAVYFALRVVFLVVLARLLDPEDFGLVSMVTAVTGIFDMFTTAGLSAAAVQRATINNAQISTLFWINVLVGVLLSVSCIASAPLLANFYKEPRLFWITVAMASVFLFSALGVQHSAILQRELRYIALAIAEALSQLASITVAIAMAIAGFGYWALVGAAVAAPVVNTAWMWMATAWIPGMPHRGVGIRAMLRFGGTVTINTVIVYIAYNFDKVLLGRFWGADALGIYGRASQLINIPTANLNNAVGVVAFSALSRLQDDPIRLRSYFLRGYAAVNSLTLPTTMFCFVFANDLILVVLGPKWQDAAVIFRSLAPTILVFGMINPLSWLLLSIGLQMRSLVIALVIAPLVCTAYLIGLPFGPAGVALAFSAAMTLWLFPHILWCLHGTGIRMWDLLLAVGRPLLAGFVAAAVASSVELSCSNLHSAYTRLIIGAGTMLLVYICLLLFIMGQKSFYLDLFSSALTKRREDPT